MVIYTKTGDKGSTSLYDGTRVSKDAIRVEAYGTVDELNTFIALASHTISHQETIDTLQGIQRKLFDVGAELATVDKRKYVERVFEEDIIQLEKLIDKFMALMDEPQSFILPGTSVAAAHFHVARTVCRRAERRIVTLSGVEEVSPMVSKYINRLSDFLYTVARYYEKERREVLFN